MERSQSKESGVLNIKKKFKPGEIIVHENTLGNSAYIIETGKVEVSKNIGNQRVVFTKLDSLLKLPIPGLGLVATILAITLIGFLASNFVGNKFFELIDFLSWICRRLRKFLTHESGFFSSTECFRIQREQFLKKC